jgi:predicted metal-dependent peptidase
MHPQRRGSRLPKLWNIAVDYIVNGTVMDDFKARKMDPKEMFTKHLGSYKTLEEYCELLKNPFKDQGLIDDAIEEQNAPKVELPKPNEDKELTEEQVKELERREKKEKFFFADPGLEEEMRRPEKIYDLLYNLLPKCPKCGSIGIYQKPKSEKDKKKDKGKKDKGDQGDQDEPKKGKKRGKDKGDGEVQDQNDQHDHGDGQPCNCPNHPGDQPGDSQGDDDGDGDQDGNGQGCGHGCDQCGNGVDVFGLGGTVDDHMDTEESEEKLAKRVSDAMEAARKMAGHVPSSLEDELGLLVAPKVTWQDFIRTRLVKARAGNGRNDWTRFKTRPMFSGLLVPKRKNYHADFGCLLDTSGSMSRDDMAFGISQLTALDERSEGTVVPADAAIYWDKATKIKKVNAEELSKVKIVGRGGTMFASFFTDYEKNIGKCDFLVVVTDGWLLDTDIAEMKNPGIDVIWLITSASSFNPPFGRVFDLRSV